MIYWRQLIRNYKKKTLSRKNYIIALYEINDIEKKLGINKKTGEKVAVKIMDKGILPNISKIASLYDMQPQELDSMMDEMKNGDTLDKLTLLLNTNTSKDGTITESKGGRPETDSESANALRDYDL